MGLNRKLVVDWLSELSTNAELLKSASCFLISAYGRRQFYNSTSIMMREDDRSIFLNLLEALRDVHFSLSVTVEDRTGDTFLNRAEP
jgi:hypothetical protein